VNFVTWALEHFWLLGTWALALPWFLSTWALRLIGSWAIALGPLGYWILGLLGLLGSFTWALGAKTIGYLGYWALVLLGTWALALPWFLST
jgi:hypothetical protein